MLLNRINIIFRKNWESIFSSKGSLDRPITYESASPICKKQVSYYILSAFPEKISLENVGKKSEAHF